MRRLKFYIIVISIMTGLISPAFGQAVEVHNYQFKKTDSSVALPYEEPKKKKDFKTWEAVLGFGQFDGRFKDEFRYGTVGQTTGRFLVQGKYQQEVFKAGAKRHFNKYFEVYGNILLSSGHAETKTETDSTSGVILFEGQKVTTFDVLVEAGGGFTPLRIDWLRYPIIELGGDLSIVAGEDKFLGGNSVIPMAGLRAGLAFSDEFVLTLKGQQEIVSDRRKSRSTTAMLGYRW